MAWKDEDKGAGGPYAAALSENGIVKDGIRGDGRFRVGLLWRKGGGLGLAGQALRLGRNRSALLVHMAGKS